MSTEPELESMILALLLSRLLLCSPPPVVPRQEQTETIHAADAHHSGW